MLHTIMSNPKVAGTIRSKNPLKGAVEVLPERLYYASLKQPPPSHNILASTPKRTQPGNEPIQPTASTKKKQIHFFQIDQELVYWNFFLDFGPLNLGQLARFCNKLHDKLRKFPVVCFYSNTVPAKRANAVFLICAWQLLYLDRTPEQAFAGFDKELLEEIEPQNPAKGYSTPPISQSLGSVTLADLPPFHDASPCVCTYDLSVLDCLRGMAKARQYGFYDHESFDVDEYEYFEQVENGDLNWIVKDQILAFAGPSYERHVSPEGYCTLSPTDYLPYFQRKNVGLVIRLNKKCYDEQDFVKAGIDHCDAFFLDGSCPPTKILMKVIKAMEDVPEDKAIAIHCKAGLGRTGTCIGAYLMKHYHFTAAEAIGWMRVCRPGMVIGPQQHFLHQIEQGMWQEGEMAGVVKRPLMLNSSEDDDDEDDRAGMDDDEAVRGREGQAAALLAARGRRLHHIDSDEADSPISAQSAASPGITAKESPVPVTPDTPSAVTQLWCGGGL